MEPVRMADGRMLRYFELPNGAGQPVNLEKYQRQRSLVIFFGHGGCAQCTALLEDYAIRAETIRDEGAEPVVVLDGVDNSSRAAATALTLLVDGEARAVEAQGLHNPALLIADRYGEVYVAWEGGTAHALPPGDEVVSWVISIERLCEECTISEWSARGEEHE